MFCTIISNQGMGICQSPAEAGGWIKIEPVIELRSFPNLIAAYRFACCGLVQRRMELGKIQPVPLPPMEAFLSHGIFFHCDDMVLPPGWVSVDVPIARFFSYLSTAYFGILTTPDMVASTLEAYPQPAVVLELHSLIKAQNFLMSQCQCMLRAVSAYSTAPVHLPTDVAFQPDIIYPIPDVRLQPAGQKIWGSDIVEMLPSVDRTPRQVMSFVSPKK